MWKKVVICILPFTALAGLVSAQEPSKSPDPEKAALIQEMMSLTRPDRTLTQFLQQYKAAFSRGFEESFRNQLSQSNEDAAKYQPELQHFEDQMFGLIADRMSWERLKPKFVAIYDETFSTQELSDIVAFYKSPPGRACCKRCPGWSLKVHKSGKRR